MLAFFGAACSNTDDATAEPTTETNPPEMMEGGERPMGGMQNLDQVATILGIETTELEDAINQAISEMFAEGEMPSAGDMPAGTPPEGTMPEGEPPEGGPPEGEFPQGTPPQGQMGMISEELLARVAEILGIDQQTLEDAFTQAQETTS